MRTYVRTQFEHYSRMGVLFFISISEFSECWFSEYPAGAYVVDIVSPMLRLCCRYGKVDSLAYRMLYAICLLCQLDMRTEVIQCFCLGEWLSVRGLLNSRSI